MFQDSMFRDSMFKDFVDFKVPVAGFPGFKFCAFGFFKCRFLGFLVSVLISPFLQRYFLLLRDFWLLRIMRVLFRKFRDVAPRFRSVAPRLPGVCSATSGMLLCYYVPGFLCSGILRVGDLSSEISKTRFFLDF
jgi:hypothetical protein